MFNGAAQLHESVKGADVSAFFKTHTPTGSTNLASALQMAVDRQKQKGKNMICIVATDGRPNDENLPIKIITDAANSLTTQEQLTFLFLQIGKDSHAAAYLKKLDDDLQSAGAKFDIVDAVSAEEAETIQPLQLLEKAIND